VNVHVRFSNKGKNFCTKHKKDNNKLARFQKIGKLSRAAVNQQGCQMVFSKQKFPFG
jgi:predicted peroxiredoxin